ncbi:MAG: BlaI/MecI/CopY family transcriptional regulator [Bacteroidetes bacterium]|nr:BlaI/MecI/CopY family transcriptional regulator [Bacteroidota bacterium]
MSKSKKQKPTESELEILQLLWELGPSSVRQINDRLNEKREVGYTTTLKIMQIMAEKELVKRNTSSRTHIYSAAVAEEETRAKLLDQLVDKAFKGSAMKLVMQALDSHQTSSADLDELKAMIEKLENDRKNA